jgi:hypothetical protein
MAAGMAYIYHCPWASMRRHKADYVQAVLTACTKSSYIDGSPWLKPPGTLPLSKAWFFCGRGLAPLYVFIKKPFCPTQQRSYIPALPCSVIITVEI